MGIVNKIQAGDFRFSSSLSSQEIAQELTHGAIDIWITFPEGTRIDEQAGVALEKLSAGGNENIQFNTQDYISRAQEGVMFPDTYLIPKDVTAEGVVAKLRETFAQKVDQKILAKGFANNLTENQVIILASLIEREAKTDEEKQIIAGILINRLKAGIPLQVDATVQYAKGYDAAKKTWWAPVSVDDYKNVKSKYNTYLIVGLPANPICNPGIAAIRAAAQPQDTDYFYYLHDQDGKIHYAKTIEEHQKNIQEFL